MPFRLGVDIGGTFTDVTLMDETSGQIQFAKVSSTPRDPSRGFLEAVQRILRQGGIEPGDVSFIVHGTTIATNAIIEKKLARTAFVTTDGFRDMLEIARQIRPSLYDVHFQKPPPLVPRYLCFGIPERLDARGNALTPLDETALHGAAARMRYEGVESVAVCFLHSYLNPAHEKRAAEILKTALPQAVLSLSSEVAPEFREYFRASTTVINAAVRPVVARYLHDIEARLRERGLTSELLVMQSSGGVFSFAAAGERPVFMVESGPAAGVIAAAHLGATLGYRDLISLDMGGTTAKTGLIQDSMPRVTKDYEVGHSARAGTGASRGGGYPIRTPVIDLVEIGAGGGSIAWVDSGGALRVGPQSAGADPGPACYGKGGTEPTVTDANMVLGRLNPDYFLGGEMSIDVEAAHQAIQEKCAHPFGMTVAQAAHGIVEIANAAMVDALHLISVRRGYDPRDFALMAFGGAGPLHANRIAAEAQIPTTIIPLSPGITSALGLLVTDLKHDYSLTLIRRADEIEPGEVQAAYEKMEQQGWTTLRQEGIPPESIAFLRQVDLRYVRQSYELTVPVPAGNFTSSEVKRLVDQFHLEHDRTYGFSAPDEPAEFVNLRLTAIGKIIKPCLRELGESDADPAPALKGHRPVYFGETGGYVDCPIYDRYALGVGCLVVGPAIVEEIDSTTVIHPGYQARVDKFGNLLLTRSPS